MSVLKYSRSGMGIASRAWRRNSELPGSRITDWMSLNTSQRSQGHMINIRN